MALHLISCRIADPICALWRAAAVIANHLDTPFAKDFRLPRMQVLRTTRPNGWEQCLPSKSQSIASCSINRAPTMPPKKGTSFDRFANRLCLLSSPAEIQLRFNRMSVAPKSIEWPAILAPIWTPTSLSRSTAPRLRAGKRKCANLIAFDVIAAQMRNRSHVELDVGQRQVRWYCNRQRYQTTYIADKAGGPRPSRPAMQSGCRWPLPHHHLTRRDRTLQILSAGKPKPPDNAFVDPVEAIKENLDRP